MIRIYRKNGELVQKDFFGVLVVKDGVTYSLDTLKIGNNYVYGKSFTALYGTDENYTITVTRLESPYQHADLGDINHGFAFYGDRLRINLSVSSGYNINTFKLVNISNPTAQTSIDITDGYEFTVTYPFRIDVSVAQAQSWKTVWTGTYQFGSGLDGGSEVNETMNFTLPSTGQTRIQCFGEAVWKDGDESEFGPTLTVTLPYTFTYWGSQEGGITGQFSVINNQINFNGVEYGDSGYSGGAVYVTKIEQYY
jgi:hypothetical protein